MRRQSRRGWPRRKPGDAPWLPPICSAAWHACWQRRRPAACVRSCGRQSAASVRCVRGRRFVRCGGRGVRHGYSGCGEPTQLALRCWALRRAVFRCVHPPLRFVQPFSLSHLQLVVVGLVAQRLWRVRKARAMLRLIRRQVLAALMVQKVWRGILARRNYGSKREQLIMERFGKPTDANLQKVARSNLDQPVATCRHRACVQCMVLTALYLPLAVVRYH